MTKPSRERLYNRLVRQRKADTFPASFNLTNPAETKYDFPHVGSHARWAGDLYADIMLVVTDMRCPKRFVKHEELGAMCHPVHADKLTWKPRSNKYLHKLLVSIERDIGLPHAPIPAGVFIADASPFLGMRKLCKHTRRSVLRYTTAQYLAPLIDLIRPPIIISVGAPATQALFEHYTPQSPFAVPFANPNDFSHRMLSAPWSINNDRSQLFPVFHPARIMQFECRRGRWKSGIETMMKDWTRIKKWIG